MAVAGRGALYHAGDITVEIWGRVRMVCVCVVVVVVVVVCVWNGWV